MRLKPGCAEEYTRRHHAIWPELVDELRQAGVSDYSIFLDPETNTLFGVRKLADGHTAHKLPEKEVMRRWWDYMADLMEVNEDRSPVARPLLEAFHLD